MIFLMKDKYSWKGIFKDIENYCQSCQTCLKSGGPRINTKNRIIATTRPNQLWQCDLIGRLKNEEGKNKFIFVAIDHYSKWTEACVLDRKSAQLTAEAVQKLIIDKHGSPESILSDNGLEFCNGQIKEICGKYSIEWLNNSPGHHQTMGCVERVNQTLLRKLRKLCDFDEERWEEKLNQAVLAVNFSFHRALQTSPYVFKNGHHPIFDIDNKYGADKIIKAKQFSKQARDNNFSTYADKDIRKGKIECHSNFKEGDEVLIYKEILGNKFGTNWVPGFIITKKLHEDAYIVSNGQRTIRLNKIHLKQDKSLSM
ncbi:MAG: integrase, partial [Aeromonas sp.]